MMKQSDLYRTTGGWEFMRFPGGNPTDGKLSAERQATCAACHGKPKRPRFRFQRISQVKLDLLIGREAPNRMCRIEATLVIRIGVPPWDHARSPLRRNVSGKHRDHNKQPRYSHE